MPANNIVSNKVGLAEVNLLDGTPQLKPVASTEGGLYGSYITSGNSLGANFSTGQTFYYYLYDESGYESGFAELQTSGAYTVLTRHTPMWYQNGSSKTRIFEPTIVEGTNLLLQATSPASFEDCLAYPNSVISTSVSGVATVVAMQNNTVLGCKDDSLQSLDSDEFSELFVDGMIASMAGKNVLCNSININSIRILPTGSRPLDPLRGTIIYNDQFNTLEFYNGTAWNTL